MDFDHFKIGSVVNDLLRLEVLNRQGTQTMQSMAVGRTQSVRELDRSRYSAALAQRDLCSGHW